MSVARITELKSSSKKSFQDAIEAGVARASKTLKNVQGAWVKDMQVECGKGGKITEYRVNLKVTFVLTD
jgi:flavin-binding protein dodecin